MHGKSIKPEHTSSSIDNRFLLHMSRVLFYFYHPCNISYFNFLIFTTRSRDFSRRHQRERCKSAPGTLTVPYPGRLHGSAPRYYNFVCTDDNPHPLPDPRKLLLACRRLASHAVKICNSSTFLWHPAHRPAARRAALARCSAGPWRILNFLEIEWGSWSRFAASASAARGNRVTDVVTSTCSIWLLSTRGAHSVRSVMTARRYLERRNNTRRSST